MLAVLCCQPFAISFGIIHRNVHNRIVVLSFFIGKSGLEGGILGIGDGCIADISIGSWCATQHHPSIFRILVPSRVDEAKKLLLDAGFSILYHFAHNTLHVLHNAVSPGFTFQFTELVFLSGYHFVIPYTHLIQQCLFVGFRRFLTVLNE